MQLHIIRLCCKRRIDARLRSFRYLRLSAHRISVSVIESLLLAGAKRGVHARTTQESQASHYGFTRILASIWPMQETSEQPDTPKQRENKRERTRERTREQEEQTQRNTVSPQQAQQGEEAQPTRQSLTSHLCANTSITNTGIVATTTFSMSSSRWLYVAFDPHSTAWTPLSIYHSP